MVDHTSNKGNKKWSKLDNCRYYLNCGGHRPLSITVYIADANDVILYLCWFTALNCWHCINANVYLLIKYTCTLVRPSRFWGDGWEIPPQNLQRPLWRSKLWPNMWFLGPTRIYKPSCTSGGSAVCLQLTINSPYFIKGWDMPLQNFPFPGGDWGPNLIHGSLGPPESTTQTASQSVQPFCRAHGCVQQTHTETDHATSIARGCIFARRPCNVA